MIEVIMPKLGLTMEEGTLLRWLKAEGEDVQQGDPLFEVQTDKVTMEVEASASGTLGKVLVSTGETVPVTQVIAYILSPGEKPPERWPVGGLSREVSAVPSVATAVAASPAARRAALEQGVDLGKVRGTGEGGSVTRQDVFDFVAASRRGPEKGRKRIMASPRARRLAQEKGVSLEEVVGTGAGGRITEGDVLGCAEVAAGKLITPGPVRKIAAQRMAESFASAPHFYLSVEVVCSKLVELRKMLLPGIEKKAGVHLTFTDMLVVLLAKVLRQHPLANASWEDGRVHLFDGVHVGIAAAVEEGLVVPVIKDADKKDLAQIAKDRKDLAEKAVAGKLTLDDVSGGTFTLTNLGMFGIDQFGPIINPPQSGILAVGRIAERAVVEKGRVVARPTVYLTLSVDHRVWDGAQGARFLADLKALIEEPGDILGQTAIGPQGSLSDGSRTSP